MPKAIVFNFPLERMYEYVQVGAFNEEDAEELTIKDIEEFKKQGLSVYRFGQEQINLF